MEKKVEVIENAMVPFSDTIYEGIHWLVFHYTDEDKDPWKWPKVIKYDGRTYMWMSWNSDNNAVNYKENNLYALPVKYKRS